MDFLNRIKRDGSNSEAQFNNKEAGIPSGPAAEFDKNSSMESIIIDSVWSHCWFLMMPYIFYKVTFFLYVHLHYFCKYTFYVRYVFNVI